MGEGGREKQSRERSLICLLLRLLHQTVTHPSIPQPLPLGQGFRWLVRTQLTRPPNPFPTTSLLLRSSPFCLQFGHACSVFNSYFSICRALLLMLFISLDLFLSPPYLTEWPGLILHPHLLSVSCVQVKRGYHTKQREEETDKGERG